MAVPAVSPQPILAPLTPAAIFLVATIGADGEATVHDALSKISGLVRAIGFRDPTKHLSVVVSIGSDAWDRLFAGPRPTELHPFVELTGPRHTAPATPGDLLFHIRAETMDVCFELAGRILKSMVGEKNSPPVTAVEKSSTRSVLPAGSPRNMLRSICSVTVGVREYPMK